MASIAAYDAKTKFAELLDRIERGETVTITRHGKPVARLMPIEDARREEVRAAVARLRSFRRSGPAVSRAELKSWIHDGHRH